MLMMFELWFRNFLEPLRTRSGPSDGSHANLVSALGADLK
jgi:hypothetical protein